MGAQVVSYPTGQMRKVGFKKLAVGLRSRAGKLWSLGTRPWVIRSSLAGPLSTPQCDWIPVLSRWVLTPISMTGERTPHLLQVLWPQEAD